MNNIAELSRMQWRCRRGVRELDLLLRRFLDESWPSLPAAQRLAFDAMLDEADPDILAWIIQQMPPKEQYRELIAVMRRTLQP